MAKAREKRWTRRSIGTPSPDLKKNARGDLAGEPDDGKAVLAEKEDEEKETAEKTDQSGEDR